MAANRVANLLSWVGGDNEDNHKKRYRLLLDRLKIRNFNVAKMKSISRQRAIKRIKLKTGRAMNDEACLNTKFINYEPV